MIDTVKTEMSSACIQSGSVRSLTGYHPHHHHHHQTNSVMGPQSPHSAWQFTQTMMKQEPITEEKNDSGITSGSDFHSSSPGSDTSQDIQLAYSSSTPNNTSHTSQSSRFYGTTPIIPNRSTSILQYNLAMQNLYNHNPLTPPSSEPLVSPKCEQIVNDGGDTTLTPCSSPNINKTEINNGTEQQNDHLRRLQLTLEKNGLYPASEHSMDDESNKSENDIDEFEQSLRVPKVNSHGKVKTFKCKQCDFSAITKYDFWEHSKTHIKEEKRLTCPKCPFVTEYKHHLEFHLNNHTGAKPFKCKKCNYACVNKSMLNSHMKSHSNVYQYRCADCSYATKYCHSLKLHLRKYSHNPAMVLNPDGTPNPLPIIDVYGTRRGPKLKHNASGNEENPKPPSPILPLMMQPQHLPFLNPFFNGFPPNPQLLQQLIQERQAALASSQSFKEETSEQGSEHHEEDNKDDGDEDDGEEEDVLDLSKPNEEAPKNRRKGRAYKLEHLASMHSSEDDEEEEMDQDDETTTMFTNVEVIESKDEKKETTPEPPKITPTNNNNNNNNEGDDNTCQYCDIAFGDAVLYTMHMGYHGFRNPFTCNMCGTECTDKVTFFLHIARNPHT